MDNRTAPLAIVGELVEIPESGYKFGVGALVLRVTKVAPSPERAWVTLTGHEIGWDGKRVGTRSVIAKVDAIKLVRHPA